MIKQLSIFIENGVGSIADVTKTLKKGNINIRAISVFDTPEFSILRLVVDGVELALPILQEEGFLVKLTDVIGVALEDEVGELDGILETIAANGLLVNYLYSLVLTNTDKPLMVLHVDDNIKAVEILNNKGFKTI